MPQERKYVYTPPAKYKIEIERLDSDSGKEWEWRVFVDSFDEAAVTGGDSTAAGAMYEAICYAGVDGFDDEFTLHGRTAGCRDAKK